MTPKGLGSKKRKKIFLAYFFVCVAFVLAQVSFGTGALYIYLGFIALLLAGSIFLFFGFLDIVALFAFSLLSKYSVFPFFIKTVMGERIDVGLLAPEKTFIVIVTGSLVTLLALVVAKSVPVGKRVLDIQFSDQRLFVFGFLAYGFGFALTVLHIAFSGRLINGQMTAGFGGFGGFTGFLYLGVICITALLARTSTTKIINTAIVIMLAGTLLLSLLANAKLYFTLSVLAYIATLFLFGRRLSFRYILGAIVLVIFYSNLVVPVIQVLRTDTFKEANFEQRLVFVQEYMGAYLSGEQSASKDMKALFNYKYYPNLHSPIIDRLEMVQDLDVVLDGINRSNTIGWQPIPMALTAVLPSILSPNKIPEVDVDVIAYNIGLTQRFTVLRRTMGLFAVPYAMFMWPGWIFISFFMIVVFLLVVRKLVPYSAAGNIFGIYFLVKYGNNFSEISVETLISVIIRGIPIELVTIYILYKLSSLVVRRKVDRYRQNFP